MQIEESRSVGRPRIHEDDAARVQAFRAKSKYPGHRYDVYLGEDAHAKLQALMKKSGLSASKTLDAILRGEFKLSMAK